MGGVVFCWCFLIVLGITKLPKRQKLGPDQSGYQRYKFIEHGYTLEKTSTLALEKALIFGHVLLPMLLGFAKKKRYFTDLPSRHECLLLSFLSAKKTLSEELCSKVLLKVFLRNMENLQKQ